MINFFSIYLSPPLRMVVPHHVACTGYGDRSCVATIWQHQLWLVDSSSTAWRHFRRHDAGLFKITTMGTKGLKGD